MRIGERKYLRGNALVILNDMLFCRFNNFMFLYISVLNFSLLRINIVVVSFKYWFVFYFFIL